MSDEKTTAPAPEPVLAKEVVRDQDKVMLVLAYLGLLSLIPLLTVKDSDYVKWHARQGLALTIVWIGAWAGLAILSLLPGIGLLFFLTRILMHLGVLALVVLGIVKAFDGQRWKIPVVVDLAGRLNF